MSKQPAPRSEQSKRFIETAKKIEADESEAAFDMKLKAIAKATPKEAKGGKGN